MGKIWVDPKTPSQLRKALYNAQANSDTTNNDLADLTTRVTALEALLASVSATFDSSMSVGMPVYVSAADHVDKADATTFSKALVLGVVNGGASSGTAGTYQTVGRVTQSDWTAVTGGASLTPNAIYYLSATAGHLTTTAPTTVGQTQIQVGIATDTTTLEVAIKVRIKR